MSGVAPRLHAASLATALAVLSCVGCATSGNDCDPTELVQIQLIDGEVRRRAEVDRSEALEREIGRLQADLAQAENALVRAESGLRGNHSRADAISSLASARIQVQRAAQRTPWRSDRIEEAQTKLVEADTQVANGNFGAALFFVHRAQRIAAQLESEAQLVEDNRDARFVMGKLVNLRAGPSTADLVVGVLRKGTPVFPERWEAPWVLVRVVAGPVGWIHGGLIDGSEAR